MSFEWDEAKNRETLERRGFEFAARIFEGRVLEHADLRRDYGEHRILSVILSVCEIEGEIFVVVYTWRGNRRRIISARRASRGERDGYRKAFGQRDS